MEGNNEQVKNEDQLWEQVNQDRATRAAGEDQVIPNPEAASEASDPLAALPEDTRKIIKELDEKVKKSDEQLAILDRKFGTANGIIGNLKQRLDESQAKLKEVEPIIHASAATRKAEAEAEAAEREAKRKAAREAVSELSPEFVEFVDMTVADLKPAQPEQAKPAQVTDKQERDQVDILTMQLDLSDKAPGWRKTKQEPEFVAWITAQPIEVQQKVGGWDVDEIASVFNSFEKHKNDSATVAQVEKERKERLSRGSSIQGRGSSVGNVDLSADAAWEKVKRDREKLRASP